MAACPLFIAPRTIPTIVKFNLALSVVGFVVVLFLLLIFGKRSQPWSFLQHTEGTSGWSVGIAWILGVANSMYPFSCTDAAIHIAEEMKSPEKTLPQVLNMTLAIGFATAFPLIFIMMLSMTSTPAVLNATLPFAELFLQSTNSKAITTFVISWVTLVLFSALIGQWVTCGRLIWAFA